MGEMGHSGVREFPVYFLQNDLQRPGNIEPVGVGKGLNGEGSGGWSKNFILLKSGVGLNQI